MYNQTMSFTKILENRTMQLKNEVEKLKFSFEGYVYNPIDYAWNLHSQFLQKYVKQGAQVMFLGMNPGPYGMMQTGVPFGEINAVVNYLKLCGTVSRPEKVHPSRPVMGLECTRSEVSGKRLWGLIADRFPNPEEFATRYCVFNYCPLGFLDAGKTAKNITPDKLKKEEREALDNVCNSYLKDVVELVEPKALIGVGKYAEDKFEKLFDKSEYIISSIIHPSPGNPQANNGWKEKTEAKLTELGLWN